MKDIISTKYDPYWSQEACDISSVLENALEEIKQQYPDCNKFQVFHVLDSTLSGWKARIMIQDRLEGTSDVVPELSKSS